MLNQSVISNAFLFHVIYGKNKLNFYLARIFKLSLNINYNLMKNLTLSILILFTGIQNVIADEGMWMPNLIKIINENDMQEMGLKLSCCHI